MQKITLEFLTEDNLKEAQAIDRSDVGEDFVDSVDALMGLTREGLKRGYLGHTFLVRRESVCVGVLLLGEGIPWKTDPEELQGVPFYRLMGFIMDRSCRGQGIGSYAVEEAIRRIYTEYGPRPIVLGCHRDNLRGEAFWLRHGFQKTSVMEEDDYYYIRPLVLEEPSA